MPRLLAPRNNHRDRKAFADKDSVGTNNLRSLERARADFLFSIEEHSQQARKAVAQGAFQQAVSHTEHAITAAIKLADVVMRMKRITEEAEAKSGKKAQKAEPADNSALMLALVDTLDAYFCGIEGRPYMPPPDSYGAQRLPDGRTRLEATQEWVRRASDRDSMRLARSDLAAIKGDRIARGLLPLEAEQPLPRE